MNEPREKALQRLEEVLGYRFGDRALLENALTHRSFVNENPALAHRDNERLEFLGDAVLELAVTDLLMREWPEAREGDLSKRRASLVNVRPLADLARRFGLGELLLLGHGEEVTGGREKSSLLANAFESLVAAVYLDGGYAAANELLRRLFEPLIRTEGGTLYRDFKTVLQERCQIRFGQFPRYELLDESGPDHDKRFQTGLFIGERLLARGEGRSKKEAEQAAARQALETLRQEPDETS